MHARTLAYITHQLVWRGAVTAERERLRVLGRQRHRATESHEGRGLRQQLLEGDGGRGVGVTRRLLRIVAAHYACNNGWSVVPRAR